MFFHFIVVLVLLFGNTIGQDQQPGPVAQDIVDRSATAIHADWEKAPEFDFCKTDQDAKAARTYQVTMISGSPYNRLIAVNGTVLSPEAQSEEAQKLAYAVQQRQMETSKTHQQRIAQYQRERHRDQELLEELTHAMQFTLIGSEKVGPYDTYVLDAEPRPGYVPKSIATKVLTGMRGRLWIDQSSYRWVKVTAQVVRPVMIDGFLARVERGTQFELEEMPVDDPSGIWMVSHFAMRVSTKIILLFPKTSTNDETYFHYRTNGTLLAEECQHP